jgi:arylsulfatase A
MPAPVNWKRPNAPDYATMINPMHLLAKTLPLACALIPQAIGQANTAIPSERPPNVVVIFTDDQGYGDLSCFGHPTIHTPNIDRLAEQGIKLTQFYVAAPVCTPSRAALLTGCYPKRVGLEVRVIFPGNDYGLHPDELTIAELLKTRGYATGCFGKWHLGHRVGLLPNDQGFDTYFGVPYSNDMSQFGRPANTTYAFRLPVIHNEEVIEWAPDQRQLTKRFTAAAVDFIESHKDEPFFVYLPHSMPHVPIAASDDFSGRSPRGLYGDVIEEIDWSVGEVVRALERCNLTENTLVIFTSDNGPWLGEGPNGGSAGPLRGGKQTNWEGGQRVPFVASWPGSIPPGSVSRELTTAMDLLPTIAALAGARLPEDRILDGHDIGAILTGTQGAKSPTESFLYYSTQGELKAIRRGPWKLWLESGQLCQVEEDISELRNLAKQHAPLVEELRELALERDTELTKNARPIMREERLLFSPERETQASEDR